MRGWAYGKPGADRLRESGGFAGNVQAAPPFLPTPRLIFTLLLLGFPPPPLLLPSPLYATAVYHQEKGAGQKAARRRAPTPWKISSIGEPRRILVSSSLPYVSVGAEILGLSTPLFPQPSFPSLTSLSRSP